MTGCDPVCSKPGFSQLFSVRSASRRRMSRSPACLCRSPRRIPEFIHRNGVRRQRDRMGDHHPMQRLFKRRCIFGRRRPLFESTRGQNRRTGQVGQSRIVVPGWITGSRCDTGLLGAGAGRCARSQIAASSAIAAPIHITRGVVRKFQRQPGTSRSSAAVRQRPVRVRTRLDFHWRQDLQRRRTPMSGDFPSRQDIVRLRIPAAGLQRAIASPA